MDSTGITRYIATLEAKVAILEQQAERVRATYIDAGRFQNIPFSVSEAAIIQGVSRAKVIRLANKGLIPKHPASTDSKFLFRASDILTMDFSKLRAGRTKKN